MKFINELKIRKLSSSTWILTQPFFANHALRGIRVEQGFKTDLASIPAWLRWLLPPDGEYKEAAVIHDWLLKLMYDGNSNITRVIAASTFLDTLVYQKVKRWKIVLLYLGVRGMDLYKWWTK